MRYTAAIMCLLMGLSIAVHGLADDDPEEKKRFLYQWTDERGVVHITDQLGNVPEKHRSKARQMETTRPGGEDVEPAATPSSPSPPPQDVDDHILKEIWQFRIAEWRERLAGATERRDKLQKERDGLLATLGTTVLAPMEARQRAEEIDRELELARKEIDEAQRMLTVVIPDEARRAGIPPGWLRE